MIFVNGHYVKSVFLKVRVGIYQWNSSDTLSTRHAVTTAVAFNKNQYMKVKSHI